ncbi:hypothetical protein PP175_06715 [Aneurinibacillus sp. Ricciae_BoGa-3]|uniref:hypothetical protein n=1 Tax=Aneurinibacillus sp. Ricciae_BoGa-3 TaxID=3022697 RepID=UPI0023400888|nr:hypothetical protein [Aneurinibacillus sp. Ricciae_BoGa-3]WCK55627.1 hypothetical protein PP175_06715 [Aneurinibacillus sp. Ricciae_BoGa-3]
MKTLISFKMVPVLMDIGLIVGVVSLVCLSLLLKPLLGAILVTALFIYSMYIWL